MENKLPEGWEWKKLGEISDIIMGQSPSGETYNENGNGMPFLQGKAEFTDSCPKHIKYTTSPSKVAPEGSILISVRAPVGDVNIANLEYCIGRGLASISLKNGDNKFLFYLLRFLKPEIENKGTGSTFKAISKSILHDLIIPLPPLETQKKIVSILEKAEETKKLRARADELTQKLLQSVFIEMFDGLHANDWSVTTVEEVVHPNKGSMRTGPFGSQLLHSEFVEEGIAVLGIDNAVKNDFEWGKRRFISESKYEELKRYTVYPGDVVITIMGTCGRCAIVPDDIPLSINTKHLCCITLNQEKCLPIYLHGYFLQHPIARHYLLSKANGAIMDGLNMKIIKDMPIIIPPIELQKKYGTIVQKINETKQTQQQSSLEINNLFDVLMQKAFTGELVS